MSEINEDGFIPIPGWPGYFVHPDGRVKSRWMELTVDHRGRFNLRHAQTGKREKITAKALLEMVCGNRPEKTPEPGRPKNTFENSEIESLGLELKLERQERKKALEQIDKLKSHLSSSLGHVKRQRGLNAMLWTRLRNLEEKLATGNADQEKRLALARAEIETWAEITESSGREARA